MWWLVLPQLTLPPCTRASEREQGTGYFVTHEYVIDDEGFTVESRAGEVATAALAQGAYDTMEAAVRLQLGDAGLRFIDNPGFYRWGDRSVYAVIVDREGEPNGFHFSACKGGKLFVATVLGVVDVSRGDLDVLLGLPLARLDAR